MCAVHPRVCGEQDGSSRGPLDPAGSSPRLRGTGPLTAADQLLQRFIPASAGNRGGYFRCNASTPVHPRVCGEQIALQIGKSRKDGSSPRLRGTDRPPDDRSLACRFIPASAGNRDRRGISGGGQPVHPRVCGEQTGATGRRASANGSSPRLRGTGHALGERGRFFRFIPASAGNRDHARAGQDPPAVHPRVCGEQARRRRKPHRHRGSSPRLRGTGPPSRRNRGETRFIPASAGNSEFLQQSRRNVTVHPRVCGEQPACPCGQHH